MGLVTDKTIDQSPVPSRSPILCACGEPLAAEAILSLELDANLGFVNVKTSENSVELICQGEDCGLINLTSEQQNEIGDAVNWATWEILARAHGISQLVLAGKISDARAVAQEILSILPES